MRHSTSVFLMMTGLAACGAGPGDPADLGMQVTVTVSPGQTRLGDTVVIAVQATNTTGGPLSLSFMGPCSLSFEVLDATGEVVAPEPPICPIIDFIPTLPAGEAIRLTFEWRGERQPGTGDYLTPGIYRVRGLLDTRSGPLPSEPAVVELTTAP